MDYKMWGGGAILLVVLVLAILSLFGLVYLSQLAMNSQKKGDEYCIQMTTTQRNLAAMAIVLVWITLIVSAVVVGVSRFRRSSMV